MTETQERGTTGRPVRGGIGVPADRVDGVAKTTGAARYSAEYPYPDLAHAVLVYSAVARGRIVEIDTTAASAVPGVLTVVTHENAPRMKPPQPVSVLKQSTMAPGTSVNYLNTDEVHWNGQPVALVVAESLDAAQHASALVRVDYQKLPATVDFHGEQRNAKPMKASPLQTPIAKKGDAVAAFAAAPVTVDLRLTTPPYHHNALEPHSTTAFWDGDLLTVHEGTQNIPWLRMHLAYKFDVPVGNVRVLSPFVGGAFGGKTMVWAGTILAVLAARVASRPVRLMLSREGVYRTVGGRTPSEQRVAIGARADGRMTALIHTGVTQVGLVGAGPEPVTAYSRHLYDAENILTEQRVVEMDVVSPTVMRAPGEAIASFGLETAVDALADELGMDPIELRMRNEPERNPIDGKDFSHRMLRECYTLGSDKFGWADRIREPGAMRDGKWLVGMGVASAYHPSWEFSANLTLRLSVDGSVVVRCGFHEMGMGGATAYGQIAADLLGVPFAAVRVEYGDSELPTGPAAGGSGQSASVAAALVTGCEKLKRSVLSLAARSPDSPLRGQRMGNLEARDGGLYRIGSPESGQTYAEILARAGQVHVDARVGSDSRVGSIVGQVKYLSKFMRDKKRWMKAACGAHFCEVRVDSDTGEVRVSRWVGVFDVGTVINPKTATSQLTGGIIMGIGMGLGEQTLVDPRTGRIMNPSLSEYHVPVHADIPPIEVHYLDEPDPTMPLGLVGVGEVGITGAAAALANAVHHATGKRVCDLPVTLDKLW